MDEKFTAKLEGWLNTPKEERDVMEGAQMLLQLRGSRFLYQNIVRKPEKMHDKLAYELQKHLKIRKAGKTLRDVDILTVETMNKAAATLKGVDLKSEDGPKYRGKRADHDALPVEIQALYDKNAELYKVLQCAYEECKHLGDEAAAPDRMPYIDQMQKADAEIAANWYAYDHYDAKAANEDGGQDEQKEETVTEMSAEEVNAARKYISDNRKKLKELLAEETPDAETVDYLHDNIQQRIHALCYAGKTFKADYQQELEEMGFEFPQVQE